MTEGAYLIDRIRHKCVEEGDCLLWQGAMSSGYSPTMRIDGTHINIRQAIYRESGREIPKGKGVVCRLGVRRCVAEEHLKTVNRGSKPGTKWTPAQRARMAVTSQARSSLDWEKVNEIRASEMPSERIAEMYGVADRTIRAIRSGKTWVMTPGVFTGLGAR